MGIAVAKIDFGNYVPRKYRICFGAGIEILFKEKEQFRLQFIKILKMENGVNKKISREYGDFRRIFCLLTLISPMISR